MSNSLLVTGVAGFIGRYVARYFIEQGWSVIGIDNSPPENAPLANLKAYHRLQLPDPSLATLIASYSPQVCVHCAGRASVSSSITDPVSDFYANTLLTLEILNTLRINAPQCKFVYLSSAAIYGNPQSLPISEEHLPSPISPYGFHKLQGEQLCLEFSKVYGLATASARIFSAYGPGIRRQVMWDICHKSIFQDSITLQGTGQESRDFIHALEIAKALFLIANKAPMQGEVYNLATGIEVTIAELAGLLLEALDYQGSLKFDGEISVGDPLNWQAEITKIQTLGFQPDVPLKRGVHTFANWCRAELVGI